MKLVLVSHGNFSKGLFDSLTMFMGDNLNMSLESLNPGDDINTLFESLSKYIETKEEGVQLLFITDILGGTPYNLCYELAKGDKNLGVLYGINLPTLIEVYMKKDSMNIKEIQEHLDKQTSIGISI